MCEFTKFFEVKRTFGVRCLSINSHKCSDITTPEVDDLIGASIILERSPIKYAVGRGYIHEETGQSASLELSQKNCNNKYLLHVQCGGGNLSFRLVKHIRLVPKVQSLIIQALKSLPEQYTAIHVRNTDHETYYQPFLDSLKSTLVDKAVAICSDDPKVLNYALSTLCESKVFTNSSLFMKSGKPLHRHENYQDEIEMYNATVNSLIDLAILASSHKLYFTNVAKGYPSGFSSLAEYLRTNARVRYGFGIR